MDIGLGEWYTTDCIPFFFYRSNTGLIECGLTYGNRFREFFRQQTGEENFKLHVDMAAMVKAGILEKGYIEK